MNDDTNINIFLKSFETDTFDEETLEDVDDYEDSDESYASNDVDDDTSLLIEEDVELNFDDIF